MSSRAPGKKVGPIYVEVDGQRVKFDLRLEVSSGTFFVEHEGQVYRGDTKAELERKLEEVARQARGREWTRYIVIDYESQRRTRMGWGGIAHGHLDLDERAPNYVTGISLTWEIREFSDLHIPLGETDEVILERDPETGSIDDTHRSRGRGRHRTRPELPKWAIPYTPERLAVLEQLRAALTAVDRKLRAFFGKDSAAIGVALDRGFEAVGLPPLALPPPEPHAPRCRSLDTECDCGADDGEDHDQHCNTITPPACSCGADDE